MGGNDSIKLVNYIISVLACINYIKASFIWFSPCHQGDNYLMIFFSVVTAAASGSHWGYKGLNGNVYIYIYIFIPTALTPKQQHWFIKVVHTILTQKTVSGLGWNVHITYLLIYYIHHESLQNDRVISSPNFKPYKCIHVPGIYSYKKEWKTMLIYLMCSHIYESME